MVDETGSSSLMRGSLAAGTSASTALAYVTDLASAVAAISSCVVVRVSVSFRIVQQPLPAPSPPERTIDEGVFIFQTSEDDKLAVFVFSGFPETLLETDGCFSGVRIDTDSAALAALISLISGGIWTDPFNVDLTDVLTGYMRRVY